MKYRITVTIERIVDTGPDEDIARVEVVSDLPRVGLNAAAIAADAAVRAIKTEV